MVIQLLAVQQWLWVLITKQQDVLLSLLVTYLWHLLKTLLQLVIVRTLIQLTKIEVAVNSLLLWAVKAGQKVLITLVSVIRLKQIPLAIALLWVVNLKQTKLMQLLLVHKLMLTVGVALPWVVKQL